jgi:hypothetical protein
LALLNYPVAQRDNPSRTRRARSSSSEVSASMRPMTRRIRSRRSATSLSVMICDRRRRPFSGATSISGRSESLSCRSDETGQTKIVERPAVDSPPWTTMPGRGLPRSLGTTINTTSPRVISTIPNRKLIRSNHRSRHFPDAAPSASLAGGYPRAPWDREGLAPSAALDAAPAHAIARGATPCAVGGFGVLPFSGSWP